MRMKAPVIDGRLPDSSRDLDDNTDLESLGLSPKASLKIADEYNHYPNCRQAIIEYKSRSVRDAVDQLEHTANQLIEKSKKVDWAIIVTKKINHSERQIFAKRKNLLWNKLAKKPVRISAHNTVIEVWIYSYDEINKNYKKYRSSLVPWV